MLSENHDALASSTSAGLPPAPAQPIIVTPFSGDYRVDALIDSLSYRWNASQSVGTAVTVTYSFMSSAPTYGGTNSGGDTGFVAFSAEQQAAVHAMLADISSQTGLTFTQVSDSNSSYGQLRFGNNYQAKSSGYAWLPFSAGDDKSGDVWINVDNSTDLSAGSFNLSTLYHETLHALGLKHPGNYNAGETSDTSVQTNSLGVVEDNLQYTIMSYRDAANGLQQKGVGLYDLLALQYLYGARNTQTGNNTYTLTSQDTGLMQLMNDNGGTDTLDASSLNAGLTIDLNAGKFSSIGASNNLAIAVGAVIENARGGSGNDTLTGNSANNILTGQGGNDVMNGGSGMDTASYSGRLADYTRSGSSTITMTDNRGTDGQDQLTSIERLQFSDVSLALDTSQSGAAGQAYGLWYAATHRTAGAAELGLVLKGFDSGQTATQVAQSILDTYAPTLSSSALVSVLFQNIVGSAPDSTTLNTLSAQIDSGSYTKGQFYALAAGLEANYVQFAGVVSNGAEYLYV